MTESISKQVEQLMLSKDFKKALELCNEKANELSKKQYLYLTSVCYRYLEDYDKALSYISHLIELDPTYGRAFQEFGHIHMKLSDKNKAIKGYIRAVRHNPSLQASWLGIIAMNPSNDGLVELAQENIKYLKDLPPELKSVISFIHEGKMAKADLLCRDFLKNHPHDIEAMRLLAQIGSDSVSYTHLRAHET